MTQTNEGHPTCSICDSITPVTSFGWCDNCELQRVALGEAFLAETGTTWLYDKGAFVLRTVRESLGLPHG